MTSSDHRLQQDTAKPLADAYPNPTPRRLAAAESGAPAHVQTKDGGEVIYFADGAVLALRKVAEAA